MSTLWADDLSTEYNCGRQQIAQRKKLIDTSDPQNEQEAFHMNSMMAGSIQVESWLSTGRDPNAYKGIDKRAIYQKNSWDAMELIPDIRDELTDGPPPLSLSVDDKDKLRRIFSALSPRERQCYILHESQGLSWADVAIELGISKSTVQTYLKRAKEKIEVRK